MWELFKPQRTVWKLWELSETSKYCSKVLRTLWYSQELFTKFRELESTNKFETTNKYLTHSRVNFYLTHSKDTFLDFWALPKASLNCWILSRTVWDFWEISSTSRNCLGVLKTVRDFQTHCCFDSSIFSELRNNCNELQYKLYQWPMWYNSCVFLLWLGVRDWMDMRSHSTIWINYLFHWFNNVRKRCWKPNYNKFYKRQFLVMIYKI